MSVRRQRSAWTDMHPMRKTFEEALAAGKRLHTSKAALVNEAFVHSDFIVYPLDKWYCVDTIDKKRTYPAGTKKVQWDRNKKRWIVSDLLGIGQEVRR